MVGKDLHLRRFTPAAENLFSLMPSDVGRPLGDVRTYLEAPDLEREVRAVIESVKVSEREVQDRDGRFYVMRIWPYLTRDDKIDGAVLVLMDVDALRQSAEEVQRALDRANAIVATVREPLVILDGELRVAQANRAFYQTFQVEPGEARGRVFHELGGGQWDRSDLRAALAEVLAKDTSFEDFEVEYEFPTMGRRIHGAQRPPAPARAGRDEPLLLAIEDRTEIKRAEVDRAALLALEHSARERAEAADHLKDQFVATVSHELRGPLTAIVGWAHILSEAGPNVDEATLAKGLATITRSVTAQDRLIADLLDHSRVVTGNLQLSRRPLALFAVAEAAIESVRAAAEAKDIELDLTGDRAASVILGDPDRMQQVLWNLFFNAVKFTPRQGRIQIWMGRVGTQVHLTVSDTGQGIRQEFLPHVFERFRRQDGTPAPGQTGLGPGPDARSRAGRAARGNRPRGQPRPGPRRHLHPRLSHPGPPAATRREGRSTAVVEPVAGKPARRAGPHAARRVERARGGRRGRTCARRSASCSSVMAPGSGEPARSDDALEAIREEVPDVLVSDIGMPGDDGYELMRRLRLLPAESGGRVPAWR